jgi:hypothetical protein
MLKNDILCPLLACPHSAQKFSFSRNGYPQFKHAGSLTLVTLFFSFVSLIVVLLQVEMLVRIL